MIWWSRFVNQQIVKIFQSSLWSVKSALDFNLNLYKLKFFITFFFILLLLQLFLFE